MFIVILFIIIKIIITNNELSKLTKYTFKSDEKITKEFYNNKKHYLLTTYYNDSSTYGFNNILYEKDNEYYLLDIIEKCDMNNYIVDSEIYYHCAGKMGDIVKYTIKGVNVEKEVINFDYKDTPNISQLHIAIDGIDDNYIYLRSHVKKNNFIKDGEFVKCSLSSKKCEYYSNDNGATGNLE